MKKRPEDVRCHHFTQVYQKSDMARDRCNYSSFWANFCPLPFKQAKKPKVRKNNVIISHVCTKNYGQMKYGS